MLALYEKTEDNIKKKKKMRTREIIFNEQLYNI